MTLETADYRVLWEMMNRRWDIEENGFHQLKTYYHAKHCYCHDAVETISNLIITGILNNVIGSGTFSKQDLCAHTWKYSKPGCAFTSENLLAQAGGEIAANKVEEKLSEYYSKFGFSSSNTYFTFKTDGTFAAKIDGKSWQGNYTFDEKTHAIQMKGLILSMSGYATKTANGISLLFDQKKLLNLIKTIGSLKGNSTLSAIGTIANN